MGMWTILEEGRDDYGRGFGMRGGSELEKAMDLFKMNRHEEEKASDLGKTDEVRIQ